jgi:hypothetical protein
MAKTGNSGTITFGTSAIVLSWTKIGEWQATRGKLPVDHLSTSGYRPYIPDDLSEPGEIEVEAYFDPTKTLGNIGAVAETITVTYPKKAAGSNPTLIGTGFLIMVSLPELVNGQVSKQKVKVAFNGATGPAFSKEA